MRFAIDEGLHAETHAVDARGNQCIEGSVGNLPWRALDGDFGIRVEMEIRTDGGKKISNQTGSKQAGGSTAKVNGINSLGQVHANLSSPLASRFEIVDEALDITPVLARRIDARREIAIGAFRPAKGDGNVEPQLVVLISGHKSIVSRRQAVIRHRYR